MIFTAVLRYTILAVSATVMLVGILVITGVLIPQQVPGQFRIVVGAVVLLYGAYRFAATFFRKGNPGRDGR